MSSTITVTKDKYKKDGIEFDRVTSILDYFALPELVDWKIKKGKAQASKEGKTAKAIGTRVHNLAHVKYVKGKYNFVKADSESVRNCMRAYDRWHNIYNPKILDMEKTIFCDKYGIAGTYDMYLPNQMNDIKTSNAIRPQYWIQLAVYAHIIGLPIEKLGIIRLDKFTGEYEYKVIDNDARLFNVYLGMLNAYRFYQGYKERSRETEISETTLPLSEWQKSMGIFAPVSLSGWTDFHREI